MKINTIKYKQKYLTADDVFSVVDAIAELDGEPIAKAMNKELVKVGLVAQIVVDHDFSDCENLNDIYNWVMANEIDLAKIVFNYDAIDRVLATMYSMDNVIKNKIDEIVESINNTNLEEMVKQMKDSSDHIKELLK